MKKRQRSPKPGDVVTIRGTYLVNPEPERANLIATEIYDDKDTGMPVIAFTPATPEDAEKIERWKKA